MSNQISYSQAKGANYSKPLVHLQEVPFFILQTLKKKYLSRDPISFQEATLFFAR
jgi:hypothetical protein